jgi:hypothetical protein
MSFTKPSIPLVVRSTVSSWITTGIPSRAEVDVKLQGISPDIYGVLEGLHGVAWDSPGFPLGGR